MEPKLRFAVSIKSNEDYPIEQKLFDSSEEAKIYFDEMMKVIQRGKLEGWYISLITMYIQHEEI